MLSESLAASLLRDSYALEGQLEVHPGERDQNFLVRGPEGDHHLLKIASAAEPALVTEFQIAALLHIEAREPRLDVPRIVRTRDGDTAVHIQADDGRKHVARVLTWLPGVPLDRAAPQADIAGRLGTALAELDLALADFEHPGSDYPLLWDMKQAQTLRALLETVGDLELRATLLHHLDDFAARIEPRFPDLRWQVIHNDLNASNVLVDADDPRHITGIIDFGDMIRAPLVIDVAVASAYLVGEDDAPLAGVFDFVRAFHSVTPLTRLEFELLPELIAMRNVLTVIISHWRAAEHPVNREYLLRSESKARRMLAALKKRRSADISLELRRHCGV